MNKYLFLVLIVSLIIVAGCQMQIQAPEQPTLDPTGSAIQDVETVEEIEDAEVEEELDDIESTLSDW